MEIIIYDHQIEAINRNKKENYADSIVYKDKDGLHQIDLDICAENYNFKMNRNRGSCIGERNILEGYFLLYTSGIPTKIVFERFFVSNLFFHHLLSGFRGERFLKFQKLLSETKYTTYDLT